MLPMGCWFLEDAPGCRGCKWGLLSKNRTPSNLQLDFLVFAVELQCFESMRELETLH